MLIRVIKSSPKEGQSDIEKLIGQTFEVVDELGHGVIVKFGENGGYLINNGEYEYVE